MTLAITIYTDDMPAHAGGITKGPLVFIRPKYKDDLGLHKHEYVHVNQWWVATILSVMAILAIGHLAYGLPLLQAATYAPIAIGVYSLLYEMVPPFRLWCEVQAYRVQIACYPPEHQEKVRPVLARFLAEKYGLRITPQEAEEKLRA